MRKFYTNTEAAAITIYAQSCLQKQSCGSPCAKNVRVRLYFVQASSASNRKSGNILQTQLSIYYLFSSDVFLKFHTSVAIHLSNNMELFIEENWILNSGMHYCNSFFSVPGFSCSLSGLMQAWWSRIWLQAEELFKMFRLTKGLQRAAPATRTKKQASLTDVIVKNKGPSHIFVHEGPLVLYRCHTPDVIHILICTHGLAHSL